MSDLPTHIQVGPMRYTVAVDQVAINAEGSSKHVYGVTLHKKLSIFLAEGMAADQEADTLLHEVLHACLNVTGQDLPYTDTQMEAVVYGLSPVLLDTLRRNPDLVAYLVGEATP